MNEACWFFKFLELGSGFEVSKVRKYYAFGVRRNTSRYLSSGASVPVILCKSQTPQSRCTVTLLWQVLEYSTTSKTSTNSRWRFKTVCALLKMSTYYQLLLVTITYLCAFLALFPITAFCAQKFRTQIHTKIKIRTSIKLATTLIIILFYVTIISSCILTTASLIFQGSIRDVGNRYDFFRAVIAMQFVSFYFAFVIFYATQLLRLHETFEGMLLFLL